MIDEFFLTKAIYYSTRFVRRPFWFIYNLWVFNLQRVKYSRFPVISGRVLIVNRGQIIFGDNVTIVSDRISNPVGNNARSAFYCSPKGSITIGDYVSMSNVLLFSQCRIEIGKSVMLGGGVQIWDTDFHPTNAIARIIHDVSKIKSAPILLKRGSFIGANAIVLKGVTVGENSIVAAGSVVSRNVPDNEIWGGNPAKFIRKVF